MKFILTNFLVLNSMLCIDKLPSGCELEKQFSVILEASIESAVYFLLDFEKHEVPVGSILYFNEVIQLENDSSKVDIKKTIDMEQLNKLSNSNKYSYVCFNTGVISNKISFLVMFYREDYLTDQNAESKFLKYKRFNIGILYSFVLDENGCLKGYTKEVLNFG